MSKSEEKAQIIREYLSGGTTYCKLGAKYGYSSNTMWRWVMAGKERVDKRHLKLQSKVFIQEEQDMPTEQKQLQEALRMARLEILLLKATIDIADEQFGTNIRKKAGTRPS
jgi:transposase-like protein